LSILPEQTARPRRRGKCANIFRTDPVASPSRNENIAPLLNAKKQPEPHDEEMDELEIVEDNERADEDLGTGEPQRKRRRARNAANHDLRINHDVPEALQQRISEELLEGEPLVWVGRPNRTLIMIRGLWGTAAGLLMFLSLLFYLLGVAFGFLEGGKGWRGWPLLLLMEAPFYLVSVGLILMPVWWGQQAIRTCYALTNRRAIVLSCAWYGALRVCSYAPDDLRQMRRADSWIYGRGAGDLIFHAAIPGQAFNHLGFLAIDRVAEVEEMTHATLTRLGEL
jgi:hypothetical protein